MSSLLRAVVFVTLVTGLALAVIPVSAQLNTVTGNDLGIPTSGTLESRLRGMINVFLGLVSLIAAAAVIYGGVKYIISAGNEKEAEAAKKVILYAVIGLIVIGLSALIVNFVISAVKGDSGGNGAPGLPDDGSNPVNNPNNGMIRLLLENLV
ncbi:MAG: pilin [Candidatus Andersenbacteria bacterium]